MLGLGLGLSRGGFVAESLLLDTYSGAAAAYSLRKLSSTYTGSAIRVRESATNTEADIGFNADGSLDTTALLAHTGANDGFVVTWYDQSGNTNDATQATLLDQPKIVSGGSVILENGKAAMDFDGVDDFLVKSSFVKSNPEWLAFGVASQDASGVANILDQDDAVAPRIAQYLSARGGSSNFGSVGFSGASFTEELSGVFLSNNTLYLLESQNSGSSVEALVNGATNGSSALSGTQNTGTYDLTIGASIGGTSGFWNGTVTEVILYDGDYLSSASGIRNNINSYYSIY